MLGKTLLYTLLVLLFCFTANAKEENPWQGEWKSQEAGRHQYGISIRKCDDSGKCEVDTFGMDDTPNCKRSGIIEPTPNTNASKLQLVSSSKFESSCAFQLERDPKNNTITLHAGAENCSMGTCEPLKAGEQRTYTLKSKENFVGRAWSSQVCAAELTQAARVWCTDADLQALAESINKIPTVSNDTDLSLANRHLDKPMFWLDKTIQKCDAATDVKACLTAEYNTKIAELKAQSQKMNAEYGPDGDVKEAKSLIEKMEGVYKKRFKNGTIDGGEYPSEDIFEFVRIADSAAYIKMSLEFFNGHGCGISGVAEYKKVGGFVFQDPAKENSCLLTIKLDGDKISFEDPENNCSKFCGARGSFNAKSFTLKQKRAIRYMPIILKSEDYQNALKQYKERHP
ncbi:MAG: hypothetical protein EB060_04770 [Proteobacteria bacterium]|nr:hypothetical protein [Pseudomonadota bacterium]